MVFNVGVRGVAIPDGVTTSGQIRLSVVLAPDCTASGPIDLENWPSSIAALLEPTGPASSPTNLSLFRTFRSDDIATSVQLPVVKSQVNSAGPAKAANDLWRTLFPTVSDLAGALQDEQRNSGEVGRPLTPQNHSDPNWAVQIGGSPNPARAAIPQSIRPHDSGGYRHFELSRALRGLIRNDALHRILEAFLVQAVRAGAISYDDLRGAGLWRLGLRATKPFRADHRLGLWRDLYGREIFADHRADALGKLTDVLALNRDRARHFQDYNDELIEAIFGTARSSGLAQSLGGPGGGPGMAQVWDRIHGRFDPFATRGASWTETVTAFLARFLESSGLGRLGVTSTEQELMRSALGMIYSEFKDATSPRSTAHYEPKHPDYQADPDKAARAKFLGIRSLPTLAKYLRLTVDVTVEPSQLFGAGFESVLQANDSAPDDGGRGTFGFLAATLGNSGPHDWSAYLLRQLPSPQGTFVTRVFVPSGIDDFISRLPTQADKARWQKQQAIRQSASPYREGVVQLRAQFPSGSDSVAYTRRFAVETIDLQAALRAMQSDKNGKLDADGNGKIADPLSVDMPSMRSRGLQLIDRGSHNAMLLALARRSAEMRRDADGPFLFADDLTRGYRADVRRFARVRSAGNETIKTFPWRTLVARSIRIGEIWSQFPKGTKHPFPSYADRDFGIVGSRIKLQPDSNSGGGTGTAVSSQALFTWVGDSLAIPAKVNGPATADPNAALNLDFVYDLPRDAETRLPALRARDAYLVGLRPVYLNGSSVPVSEAARLYDAGCAIGDNDTADNPYQFRPYSEVRAPEILLHEDGRLVTNKSGKGIENENIHRIVLMNRNQAGNVLTNRNQAGDVRYVMPPRVNFEHSEMLGEFDAREPKTALYPKFLLDQAGDFPNAINGRADLSRSPPVRPTPRSRGPVLQTSKQEPIKPKQYYFPDPLARNLTMCFERDGECPAGFPITVGTIPFWKDGEVAMDALPVKLLFRRWIPTSPGDGMTPDDNTTTDFGGRVSFDSEHLPTWGGGADVQRVVIDLAPAEEVNLLVWSYPDAQRALDGNPVIYDAMSLFSTVSGQPTAGLPGALTARGLNSDLWSRALASFAVARDGTRAILDPAAAGSLDAFWTNLMTQRPFAGVCGFTKLTVVHPVKVPLKISSVTRHRRTDGNIGRNIAVVRVAHDSTWSNYLDHARGTPPLAPTVPSWADIEQLELRSESGGRSAYIAGELSFDRASTGALACEATWLDSSDGVAVTRKTINGKPTGPWMFLPGKAAAQVFDIKSIPRAPGLSRPGCLDLLQDEKGQLRNLSYNFGDTAARHLSLKFRATSRFVREYPDADNVLKNTDLLAAYQNESEPVNVTLFATAAPPSPVVHRTAWMIGERRISTGNDIIVEKTGFLRVYLDRPWYVSGPDELLAVICAPSDLFARQAYDPDRTTPISNPGDSHELWGREVNAAPDLRSSKVNWFDGNVPKGLASFLTRWGRDPTTKSNPLNPLMEPDRLSGLVATYPDMKLTKTFRENVSLSCQVAIAAYKPQLDQNEGRWFVDIGIDSGQTHQPFVHLSIARFQPYAVGALQLSEPVRLDPIQLQAKRRVEVRFENDSRVLVRVSGVGHTQRQAHAVDPQAPKEIQERIDMPLQNFELKRLSDDGSSPIQSLDRQGRPIARRHVTPIVTEGGLRWSQTFDLPLDRKAQKYRLLLDEVELHQPDPASTTPEQKTKPQLAQLKERPIGFSFEVDLFG